MTGGIRPARDRDEDIRFSAETEIRRREGGGVRESKAAQGLLL